MRTSIAILTVATALVAAPAEAGGLKREWVAADATWILHVDVEEMRASKIGSFIIEHQAELDLDLEDVREEIGLDPVHDFHNITVYGSGNPEEKAVVVATVSAAVDEVLEHARQEEQYYKVIIDDHAVHAWGEDGESIFAHIRESGDRRIVVISGQLDLVRSGIAVLEGDRESLAHAKASKLKAHPEKGTLVFMAASGLPWLEDMDDKPASTLIRQSDHVMANLSEVDGETKMRVAVATRSEADARDISDVLTGLLALGRLMASEEPELRPVMDLARNLRIHAEGAHVEASFQASSTMLIEHLRAMIEHHHHHEE